MSPSPTWERRFRSPVISFPAWSVRAPDRLVVSSSEGGSYQLHAWDRGAGTRRVVTDEPVGVTAGRPTPDGHGIVWFRDETGAETGTWVVLPFDGGGSGAGRPATGGSSAVRRPRGPDGPGGAARSSRAARGRAPAGPDTSAARPVPLLHGLPVGWEEGLALGASRSLAGISTSEGFGIYVADRSGRARRIHHHPEPVRLAGDSASTGGTVDRLALSADERFACLEVMDDGDVMHPGLRVIETHDGRPVAEVRDPGLELACYGWSPVPGDARLAITHERTGEHRPAIWDLRAGTILDLPLDLAGEIAPVDWWPDASALLLRQLVDGRHRLHRLEIATGRVELLSTYPGSITAAAVRPDGHVWYRVQSGERSGTLHAVGAAEPLLAPDGPPAPEGRPFRGWSFSNPPGDLVQGFTIEPDGQGPHPLLVRVHGGPHSVDLDRWAPDLQAYVDAGFLVALVNYRGSIGFGPAWRDALTGNVGFLELEDVIAGIDDLAARGLADPDRVVLAGWSWGGYVTLLGAGRHPDRWVAAVAGVPVADYVAAYEDESPILQALDRALLGGSPDEVPELIRERSPITYVDAVTAPLLVLAGENDSRCPIRQIRRYLDRLEARGIEPTVYLYETGHASYDVDERIRQAALVLDFLARHVPGIERLPGVEAWLPHPGTSPTD